MSKDNITPEELAVFEREVIEEEAGYTCEGIDELWETTLTVIAALRRAWGERDGLQKELASLGEEPDWQPVKPKESFTVLTRYVFRGRGKLLPLPIEED